MSKELQDMTYQELVEESTRMIFDRLITEGGSGLKSAVWNCLQWAIQWKEAQDKKVKSK